MRIRGPVPSALLERIRYTPRVYTSVASACSGRATRTYLAGALLRRGNQEPSQL